MISVEEIWEGEGEEAEAERGEWLAQALAPPNGSSPHTSGTGRNGRLFGQD